MASNELEAKVKTLTKTIEKLGARLQAAEDIEAVKKLQKSYSYYLEHWQEEELLGLWSHSPDITFEVNDTGQFKGWEDIKKAFHFKDHYPAYGDAEKAPPEYLHILPSVVGIVDLDPDGKTAKGRWYGFGMITVPPPEGKAQANLGCGIWENEYVKEDGKWKFKKINYNVVFNTPFKDGWVKTPYIQRPKGENEPPHGPDSLFAPYPSDYIFPYHYKNPVTGK